MTTPTIARGTTTSPGPTALVGYLRQARAAEHLLAGLLATAAAGAPERHRDMVTEQATRARRRTRDLDARLAALAHKPKIAATLAGMAIRRGVLEHLGKRSTPNSIRSPWSWPSRHRRATLRNPHANPVAAVVIDPHGPFAPFPAGLPRMRERMDTIVSDAGHAWRPRVEAALRAVPRHMFVPRRTPGDTYRAHTAVVTKRSCATLNSASAPAIVAIMLDVRHEVARAFMPRTDDQLLGPCAI